MNDLLIAAPVTNSAAAKRPDLERKHVYGWSHAHTQMCGVRQISSKNMSDLERKHVYVWIHGDTWYRGVGAVFRGVRSSYFKYIRMRFVLLIQTARRVCEHTLAPIRRLLFVIQTYEGEGWRYIAAHGCC